MITLEIERYCSELKGYFDSISNIWLIGSKANGGGKKDSDWDLLIFTSIPIYDLLRREPNFNHKDVDLILVDCEGEFSRPFGEPIEGSLKNWQWEMISENIARYVGTKWVDNLDGDGSLTMGEIISIEQYAHLIL